MFKYKLIKIETNEKIAELTLETDVENPWQDKFDKHGIVLGFTLLKCRIEKENIDAEIAAEQSKKESREAAKLALKDVKAILTAAKALSNSPEKAVIKDLAKAVLQISKALNLADALESES